MRRQAVGEKLWQSMKQSLRSGAREAMFGHRFRDPEWQALAGRISFWAYVILSTVMTGRAFRKRYRSLVLLMLLFEASHIHWQLDGAGVTGGCNRWALSTSQARLRHGARPRKSPSGARRICSGPRGRSRQCPRRVLGQWPQRALDSARPQASLIKSLFCPGGGLFLWSSHRSFSRLPMLAGPWPTFLHGEVRLQVLPGSTGPLLKNQGPLR